MRKLLVVAAVMIASAARAVPNAAFESAAPKGWSTVLEEDGVTYVGPRGDEGVAAQINVRYVAPGQGEADAAACVARLTRKPEFDIPGNSRGPAVAIVVAGRKAERVAGTKSEFPGPRRLHGKKVPMAEAYVVVPAAKGYYVLLSYAPKSVAKRSRAAFNAVLAGFKPKL